MCVCFFKPRVPFYFPIQVTILLFNHLHSKVKLSDLFEDNLFLTALLQPPNTHKSKLYTNRPCQKIAKSQF